MGATGYGINIWNGVCDDLTLANESPNGTMQDVNLGILAAPPGPGDLHPAEPDSHWLPLLTIE